MTELQHTPEHWTAETYAANKETGWCVKDGDDTVCDVWAGEMQARRIAALPKLVDALRHCLVFAEFELEMRLPSEDTEYIGLAQKAVDTARAALGKSTGGAA